ncbi:MAG: NADP-dependent isocitrate dehydrogenase [Bdellovibrionales bacterium]
MSDLRKITVAHGNGIGPEIMDVALDILKAAKVPLEIEEVKIGEEVYKAGNLAGIEDKTWESLHRTKVFLKAPITTPQGGGYRSLNVTVRKSLGLYANVRPCVSYYPYLDTKHPKMDLVIIRENEEDLYSGIEYRQTQEVYQSLKLLSYRGSSKIIKYAFEYAKQNNRKKVTCFTKDNIMKISDGMFHNRFEEISKEYPDIESEHWIVDIGMAKVADSPEQFDVIVLPNLYGDILSDITAQITGSVGLAGSSNIGGEYAMFEAIHGSAPRRAGQNLANPSGLLLAAVQMLVHLNFNKEATMIQNAWLKTLEDGIHTYDIYKEGVSHEKVGTKEFGKAVIKRFGEKPKNLNPVSYQKTKSQDLKTLESPKEKKELVGVDVYIDARVDKMEDFVKKVKSKETKQLKLNSVSSRGLNFWPGAEPLSDKSDHWRCRFSSPDTCVDPQEIINLLSQFLKENMDLIKTENLYNFNGKPGYSQASKN